VEDDDWAFSSYELAGYHPCDRERPHRPRDVRRIDLRRDAGFAST